MDELNEKKIEEQIDENTVASSSSPIDEQNSTIEETIDKSNICAKCGATLEPDQLFCPKCGAPKNSTKRICPKCAAELTSEQEFCPKCGHRVGNSASVSAQKSNVKKKIIVLLVALGLIVLVILAAAKILPKVFMDYEGYMEQGNYVKAYEKAETEDEKLIVVCENAAMVESEESASSLKDPSSFVLRNGYLQKKKDSDGNYSYRLVLHISGNNSYGASVSSYWLFVYNGKKDKWEYWASISDFDKEEFKSWDDYDDKLEKTINNLCRDYIKEAISAGVEMSKDGVKRVNTRFEEDTLDQIELLDVYADADAGDL